MNFDLNLLKQRVHVRPDTFEGGIGWTWISDNDMTWDVICNDWTQHHKGQITKWFPSWFPRQGTTAIMAGGNCGLYPALLSQYFAMVYTFEPDPVHFHCLVNNCQFPNVIKIQAALGATSGMVAISKQFQGNTGMTQVASVDRNSVPCMTVDSLDLKSLDLMFLDTEGFEGDILRGAEATLVKYFPKLILELGDVDQGELKNHDDCVAFLKNIGYDKFIRISRLDYAVEKTRDNNE